MKPAYIEGSVVMEGRIEDCVLTINGSKDAAGRCAFTVTWSDPNGPYITQASREDGRPVGYRRGRARRWTIPAIRRACGGASASSLSVRRVGTTPRSRHETRDHDAHRA